MTTDLVLLTENCSLQGLALWLTSRRRVPTGSSKHLLSSWQGFKITLHCLLTINCPDPTQLALTFHLTRSHHNCLSKGVAKNKSYTFIRIYQAPVRALCYVTPGERSRTGIRAFLENVKNREVKCHGPKWRVEGSPKRSMSRTSGLAKRELASMAQ